MPTFVDGIASSEAIDTAGEIVDLLGLDCSSLEGAALNWEHKSDQPSQIVGKVLSFKKIFSEKDIETDRQKMFWEKVKMPFLYILGRLFDDKKDSSREVAGLFIDDAEHPDEHPMVGFSIEGAKIHKDGLRITKSIARKVTITNIPANKTCLAEMVPANNPKQKDDLDGIFKSETAIEIEVFSLKDKNSIENLLKKENPDHHANLLGIKSFQKGIDTSIGGGGSDALSGGAPSSPSLAASEKTNLKLVSKTNKNGAKIGRTQSGKDIMSHGMVGEYKDFSAQDHRDAAAAHKQIAEKANQPKLGQHHFGKHKLHMQAANKLEDKYKSSKKPAQRSSSMRNTNKLHDPDLSGKMDKALTAGSMMAAPSNLTGGAALGKESLSTKPKNVSRPDKGFGAIIHKPEKPSSGFGKVVIKSEMSKRAEEAYNKWNKKEQFREFMTLKLPQLAIGEIDAIGKTIALKKSIEVEKALANISKQYKSSKKK